LEDGKSGATWSPLDRRDEIHDQGLADAVDEHQELPERADFWTVFFRADTAAVI